jgi:tetratricopeptide (TPR) repeat protein
MKSRLPKQIYILMGAALLLGVLLMTVNQQVPDSESEKIQDALDEATLIAGIPSVPNLAGWPKDLFTELKQTHAALNEASERVAALGRLGEIYFANGFYGEAAQCFTALIKIAPKEPRWPYFMGLASSDYQDKSVAIQSFERARLLDTTYPRIRYELGLAFVDSGHILDSIVHFESLTPLKEWEPWAYYGLARGLVIEERYEKALEFIERAIELDPDVKEFYSFAEELMLYRGDRAKVEEMEAMKNALSYEKRPFDLWSQGLWECCYDTFRLLRLAEAEALAGNRDRSLEILAKAKLVSGSLEYDPSSFEAIEALIRVVK